MPTIREVAKRAGASPPGTVSRYLNGHQLKAGNQAREIFVRKLENLIDRRVDGLVLVEPLEDDRARRLIEQSGIPTRSFQK